MKPNILAIRARSDYFFFLKYILGFSKITKKPHQEMCDFITTSKKRKKLILSPRGSFKSSCVTVGGALFKMVQNPNIRILIASETQKNAKRYVGEIAAHIETNPKFKMMFGNWVSNDRVWRDDELCIAPRTIVRKESSVTASSLEKGTIVGLHFDLIILDDVVSRNNINSPEQLQKTIDYYRLLLSILEPDGEIYVVGTRWFSKDLYSFLSDADSTERDQFDVFVRAAIDNEGNLLMPDVLTREFLDEQKKTQGNYIFNAQYMNNATSREICAFKQESIKFFDEPPSELDYFITVDPAYSKKETADYTAIIVNGVDYYGNWFIVEAIRERYEISETVDKLIHLVDKYNDKNVMCVGMEQWMLEKILGNAIRTESMRRGKTVTLVPLQTNTRISKEARIMALQPKFESGIIHIKREQEALYHEILFYPQVKHDDLLDALKSQIDIAKACSRKSNEKTSDMPELTRNEKFAWDNAEKYIKRRVKERY